MQGIQDQSDRANATAQKQKVSALTRSFADLARMMAAVEGRKYVVYLSEGSTAASSRALRMIRSGQSRPLPRWRGTSRRSAPKSMFGDSKTLNEVEAMLEEFRRADCAVQAVDIGGLRAEGEQGARRGGKDSLLQIARGTGGELFENTNNLGGAMQSMLKRTSVTYVLAFQPDKLKLDGGYHRLKVELKNQPRGTRDPPPGQLRAEDLRRAEPGREDDERRRRAAQGRGLGDDQDGRPRGAVQGGR